MGGSTTLHVYEVKKFNWRNLLYFISTKWKILAGELDYISSPQSGKVWMENPTTFHVHEVEDFSWRTLIYFMSNWRDTRYFMSTKRKCLAGELYDISCSRSGKVCPENSTKTLFYKVGNVLLRDLHKFHVRVFKKLQNEFHVNKV